MGIFDFFKSRPATRTPPTSGPCIDGFDWASVLKVTKPLAGITVHIEFGLLECHDNPAEAVRTVATATGRQALRGRVIGLMNARFFGVKSNEPEIPVHPHFVIVSRERPRSGRSGSPLNVSGPEKPKAP